MVNQPPFGERCNSSSVISSQLVVIITSLASLYSPRCCSYEDVVTLARFPRLCFVVDVSAARFPRCRDMMINDVALCPFYTASLSGIPEKLRQ